MTTMRIYLLSFLFAVSINIQAAVIPSGWNLLANDQETALDVKLLFGYQGAETSLTGSVRSLWVWDASSHQWQFYSPTMTLSEMADYAAERDYQLLTQIEAGQGYWLNAEQELETGLVAFPQSASYQLPSGWSLLGNVSGQAVDTQQKFGSADAPVVLSSDVISLWAWDQGQWSFYSPQMTSLELQTYVVQHGYQLLSQLEAGQGFWLNTAETLALDLTVRSDVTTYYVDDTGHDQNPGTESEPFQTLAKGVSMLQAGDMLQVQAGEYMERLHVNNSNGSAAAPLTIIAAAGAILDGPDNYPDGPRQNIRISSDHVVVKGFEARNSGMYGVHVDPGVTDVVLSDLYVHHAADHGVQIEGSSVILQHSVIVHNMQDNVNHSASRWGSGIKLRLAEDVVIKRNLVYANWGEGIAATRSAQVSLSENQVVDNFSVNIYVDNSSQVDVSGNFCYCNEDTTVLRDGSKRAHGIATAEEFYQDWGNQLSGVRVVNNIVHNCYSGFRYAGSDSGEGGLRQSLVYNNTFYQIEKTAIDIKEGALTSLQFRNNLVHSRSGSYDISNFRDDFNSDGVAQGITLSNNLWASARSSADKSRVAGTGELEGVVPDFEQIPQNEATSFRPSSDSPVVNAGYSVFDLTLAANDFERNARPAVPDIGALQQGGGHQWFDDFFSEMELQAGSGE